MIQIEIPILDEPVPDVSLLQSGSVVRLQFQLPAVANVIQVPNDGPQIVAVLRQYLDHNFRRTPDSAANEC